MLKIIAIFILLGLNSTSINNTLINNSSMNDTLLNNSSINNTLLNNSTSEDDWFNKTANLNFTVPLNLFSDDARVADANEEQEKIKFPAKEEPRTYNPIWNWIHPPAITISDSINVDLGPQDISLDGGVSGTVCSEDGICYEQFVD